MTIQQAITKAIEGGWKEGYELDFSQKSICGDFVLTHKFTAESIVEDAHGFSIRKEQIFLDPLFWQSLGKAMGWSVGEQCCGVCGMKEKCEQSPPCYCHRGIYKEKGNEWKQYWHDFIGHLAEGKDAQSFFDSLGK